MLPLIFWRKKETLFNDPNNIYLDFELYFIGYDEKNIELM